eukprot:16441726-Heterocapsa_arctica.AAC.1
MGGNTLNNIIPDLLSVAIEFLAKYLSFSSNYVLERPMLSLKSTGTNKWQQYRCQNTLDLYEHYCAPMCGAPR